MKVYIVSRHPGTIEYLKRFYPDAEVINHLKSPDDIPSGSLVIGNLPLTVVARLKERGVRYVQVNLEVPPELRGKELDVNELEKYVKLVEIKELKIEEFKPG